MYSYEIEKLLKLQENSYVPVSGYRTSAIVITKDGKMFEGVNVENPSFRDGMCAEQTAIASACANGYGKNIYHHWGLNPFCHTRQQFCNSDTYREAEERFCDRYA